jgi:lambda repressor-like predicted transcriptional regulator
VEAVGKLLPEIEAQEARRSWDPYERGAETREDGQRVQASEKAADVSGDVLRRFLDDFQVKVPSKVTGRLVARALGAEVASRLAARYRQAHV